MSLPSQLVSTQLPKFYSGMSLVIPGEPDVHYSFTGEVPKEVMDAYQEVIGNGLARVSVSADMGIKDFGTGASAMVSISLTCGQDEQTLARAVYLAGNLARHFAHQNRQAAETELMGVIAQKKQVEAGSPGRPNYG